MTAMPKSRLLPILVRFFLLLFLCAGHIAAKSIPKVVAVFPLGMAKGSTSEIEIWGSDLEGIYGVWFANQGLTADVKKVERIDLQQEVEAAQESTRRGPTYRATVELHIDSLAELGRHWLRVVSSQGMSNAHPFVVTSNPVRLENETNKGDNNLESISVPALISGRLREKGEADYYSFDAAPGQAISFQAVSNQATKSGGFDAMQLTLYESRGSWFDANRPTRLCFSDDARMTYNFTKRGRYLLQVSGFLGISGPDVVYLLDVAPIGSSVSSNQATGLPQLQTPGIDLVKGEFRRKLDANRVEMLLSRTAATTRPGALAGQVSSSINSGEKSSEPRAAAPSATPSLRVPNASKGGAGHLEPSLPLVLEGAIDRPGKIDNYRLMLKAGQQLAFEIETPEATVPEFSPRLELLDTDGQEIFNNTWRRVGGDNNQWMKTLQAKTMYSFNRDGEYTLQIQDMTPRNGDSSFRYRILIRPIIPHVGKVAVKEDSINLVPGQAKRLTVTVEQEEGYTGEVALSVENLPTGVQSSTGADVPPDPEPLLDQGKRDQYVPKSQKVTILLVGSQDAPPTTLPRVVRLVARPVVQGQVGSPVWSEDIPVMVLKKDSAEQTAGAS